ncbi:hypothetical protein BV898_07290 [Hypsibius exemplaris]|uniref:Uncharacterized protein n=1 Tax=Hypsibius exemplaris TaxID=2072580 RepID=A0A1W0WTY9_HYPEX|nr:hypothetical protein BV898_07290 [Hypsibius exemplaris]
MCAISAHSSIEVVIVKKSVRSAGKRRLRSLNLKAKLARRMKEEEEEQRALEELRSVIPEDQFARSFPKDEEPSGDEIVLAAARLIQQLEVRLRSLPNAAALLPELLQFQMWKDTNTDSKVSHPRSVPAGSVNC